MPSWVKGRRLTYHGTNAQEALGKRVLKGTAIATEEELISEFMAADKVASSWIQWTLAPHHDTAKASVPLIVPSRPSFSSSLCLGANVMKTPGKYEFSIVLGSRRVAALDINPAGGHYNFVSGSRESVRTTHWHQLPDENVVPDARQMTFRQWLVAFCRRQKIEAKGSDSPPHLGGEQGRLF